MATIPVVSSESGAENWNDSIATRIVNLGTTVDPDHSVITATASGGSNSPGTNLISYEILSGGTQILFTRNAATAVTWDLEWRVTEFDTSVSVETFEISDFGGGVSQLITEVDLTRSVIISGGMRNAGSTSGSDDAGRLSFIDSTHIEADAIGSNTAQRIIAQVVEFPANAVESVEYISGSTNSASVAVTISSVDENKSVLFSSAMMSANFAMDDMFAAHFTSATNIQLTKTATGNPITTYGIFVLEFVDYEVLHGAVVVSTEFTETEVLDESPADGDVFLGAVQASPYLMGSTQTDDNTTRAAWSASLSGSTWTFTRTSTANDGQLYYSLIDWGQSAAPVVGNFQLINGGLINTGRINNGLIR